MKIKFPIKQVLLTAIMLSVVTVMICMVAAALVVNEVLPEEGAVIAVKGAMLLAILIVCRHLAQKRAKNRMQISLLTGVTFIGICFLVGMLLFAGRSLKMSLWPIFIIAASALAGVISSMKRERRR